MWGKNGESSDHTGMDRCLTRNASEKQSSWKSLYSLLRKDCRMMVSGKFFFVALGSLMLYTLFINFGYVKFMNADANIYNVYLYDPEEVVGPVSPPVYPVASPEELFEALERDTGSGVGIRMIDDRPDVVLYGGAEKADCHKADYALAMLYSSGEYATETVGRNTPEMKQRKEMTCELLFIELAAVGFLGIASMLFKEKQMGVIRVHAIMPLSRNLFLFSKVFLFLLADLIFAALMTLFNVRPAEAGSILPAILIQTGILSLIMAFIGFGCTMLLKDFKQFSLLYLVIALFAAIPVFLSANPLANMEWIRWYPFYQLYMGMKNAFFGMPVTSPVYYICAVCAIILLFGIVGAAFHREMGKEG